MRLKTYQASTTQEAMQLIREQLGPDAIIVATHDDAAGRGVRVTAAIEESDTGVEAMPLGVMDSVYEALKHHETAPELLEKLVNIASKLNETDPVLSLAAALNDTFKFAPLPNHAPSAPLVFIGPPGVGKTVCVAKLAARARLAGHEAHLISTDTIRAGALDQLNVYADRLGLTLATTAQGDSLDKLVQAAPSDTLVLIDTPAVNPYDPDGINALIRQINIIECETILVMNAGYNSSEGIDIARGFQKLKPARLFVTGLDFVRRLGGVLALSNTCDLPFCDVSRSPAITDGLHPVNPVSLARLLMPQTDQNISRGVRAESTRTV